MIKYVDDYVDELAEEFPMISKKSLKIMINFLAKTITMFMRVGAREIKVSSRKPLVKKTRAQETFYITRISGLRHRRSIVTKARRYRDEQKK